MTNAAQSTPEVDFRIEASEIVHYSGGVEFFEVDKNRAAVRMSGSDTVPLYDWLHALNDWNTPEAKLSDVDLRELAVDICFTVMPGVIPRELMRREADQASEVVND